MILLALLLADDSTLSQAGARKLRNPVPRTAASTAQGKATFLRMCAGCHGRDGKSTSDVPDARDLTAPQTYQNGTTDGEIFRTIHDGLNASMPPFKNDLKSDELWHLVNFIQTLWPEPARR